MVTPEKRQRAEMAVEFIRKGWQPPKKLAPHKFEELIDNIELIGSDQSGAYAGHHGRNESLELTDKELVVLSLLAEGHTNQSAADAMHYSVDTVKSYVKTIMAKLGAKNATHAVAIAYRSGDLNLRRAA